MLTLVLLATIAAMLVLGSRAQAGPLPLHSATRSGLFRTAPPTSPREVTTRAAVGLMTLMARGDQADRPPPRPIRNPFATSDPLAKHRAVTGINAHVRWYHRVGSLIGIVVLVALMGVLLAACIGVAFFAARIILELLVG